jgi:hypothetical protein
VFRVQAFQAGARIGKLAALPSALDTLAYVRRLRSVGVSQEQAEAHAEALSAAVLDTLATKQDLRELALATRQDLRDLEFRLTLRLGGMAGVSVTTVAVLTKLL